MAVYKTDRQRRILGDRMLARGEELSAIHPAVAEVHGLFADVHEGLKNALEERRREEGEGALAREKREEAAETSLRMYSWAYHQVEPLLQPSWEGEEASDDAASVRARLFPMGNPTAASVSAQITLDGLTHFLAAAERETTVTYPSAFLTDARAALGALEDAFAEVTREDDEKRGAAGAVTEARERWDTTFASLRDVASCYLRLNGEISRLNGLFRELPSSGSSTGETASTTEAASE